MRYDTAELEPARNPATPERPMGGPDADNQPPPPPPETDPRQDYDERHMGIPRPQSNDANQPAEELGSDWFPAHAETLGVREDALRDA